MKSRTTTSIFVLGIICVMSLSLYSQIDPNVPRTNITYETKFLMPKAYNINYEQPDVLIAVGAFDNFMVSSTNGFAETDIAVNVRNPNNFVASDNRVTGFSGTPFIYYTTNGGVTWLTSTVSSSQGDPVFC